jgi:energy-coupling factor transporter ATP-binding protein EcfA2
VKDFLSIKKYNTTIEMPKLSFEKEDKDDQAVAIVKGGTHDKEILWLHDDSILSGKKKCPSKSGEAAAGAGTAAPESSGVIKLDPEGQFELIPSTNPKKREVWYIAGQSGSGKSYIAKTLAHYYHKLYADRGVYLVSKLEKDETLDALPFIKRLSIQSFIVDYPALEEFKDCMVIFDDYDTLTGDAQKVVEKIIDDLAIQGRHTNTTMLCLSHYLTNYKKTRLILNEATHIVVYPMSTSYKALRNLLTNYVGVDEEDLSRHRKLGSRWICYKKGFPMFAITMKTAELLFC